MPEIKHTPGPWCLATSNSWRRIENYRSHPVCTPTTQRDGHPDMVVSEADAKLITAAPELLLTLGRIQARLEAFNEDGRYMEQPTIETMLAMTRTAIKSATE
jgi:hypothetical protein